MSDKTEDSPNASEDIVMKEELIDKKQDEEVEDVGMEPKKKTTPTKRTMTKKEKKAEQTSEEGSSAETSEASKDEAKKSMDQTENSEDQPTTSKTTEKEVKKESEDKEEEAMREEIAELLAKHKKQRKAAPGHSIICQFEDTSGNGVVCKQRAILGYRYCIRHILLDPEAPYKQCEHQRKPKSKKDTGTMCTNAIRINRNEEPDRFCSTHLIMHGLKEAKKKNSSATTVDPTLAPPMHIPLPATIRATVVKSSVPLPFPQIPTTTPASPITTTPSTSIITSTTSSSATTSTVAVVVKPECEDVPTRQEPTASSSASCSADERSQSPKLSTISSPSPATSTPESPSSEVKAEDQPCPSKKIEVKRAVCVKRVVIVPPEMERSRLPRKPHPNQALLRRELLRRLHSTLKEQRPMINPKTGQPVVQRERQSILMRGTQHLIRMNPAVLTDKLKAKGLNLSPQVLHAWRTHVVHRLSTARITRLPFSQIRQHPYLAARLLESGIIKHPAHKHVLTTIKNQPLPWPAQPLRPRSPQSEKDDRVKNADKRMITLRQKKQKRKMVGQYRAIPPVDHLCRLMEDQDFDKTDMFPLGLEPSDDEDTDVVSIPKPTSSFVDEDEEDGLQIFLSKKQLRLERHSLFKEAQLSNPLFQASRKFPMSLGAALRQRQSKAEAPPYQRPPETIRRCYFVDTTEKKRCSLSCLPMANHCKRHLLANVEQRLYSYCSQTQCRQPVAAIDAFLWDGKCQIHRSTWDEKYGENRKPIEEEDDELDEEESEQMIDESETGQEEVMTENAQTKQNGEDKMEGVDEEKDVKQEMVEAEMEEVREKTDDVEEEVADKEDVVTVDKEVVEKKDSEVDDEEESSGEDEEMDDEDEAEDEAEEDEEEEEDDDRTEDEDSEDEAEETRKRVEHVDVDDPMWQGDDEDDYDEEEEEDVEDESSSDIDP